MQSKYMDDLKGTSWSEQGTKGDHSHKTQGQNPKYPLSESHLISARPSID